MDWKELLKLEFNKKMRKKIFYGICFLILFSSCQESDRLKKETSISNATPLKMDFENLSKETNFKKYLSKFKDVDINNDNLSDSFYIYFENDFKQQLTAIPKNEKDLYLKDIEYDKIYYGYKLQLKDNNWLILYYLHNYNVSILNEKESCEVCYFKICTYDKNGYFKNSLNIVASDIGVYDPVYNLNSKLYYNRESLHIETNELYYNKNQLYNDSIVVGQVTHKKYVYDQSVKFILKESETREANLVISTNKFQSTYLRVLN